MDPKQARTEAEVFLDELNAAGERAGTSDARYIAYLKGRLCALRNTVVGLRAEIDRLRDEVRHVTHQGEERARVLERKLEETEAALSWRLANWLRQRRVALAGWLARRKGCPVDAPNANGAS
jgi:hypothetical protein